jgi:hypothetical protein
VRRSSNTHHLNTLGVELVYGLKKKKISWFMYPQWRRRKQAKTIPGKRLMRNWDTLPVILLKEGST